MNTEAILGIKKAAAKCHSARQQIIKELQSGTLPINICTILNKEGEINIKITANGTNQEINKESVINFHIEAREANWSEKYSFSYYSGQDSSIYTLIDINKNAVIETAQELCPGFPKREIYNVLDMHKAEYFYTYKNEPADKTILKAGDIIFVDALFSINDTELGKSPCAYHRESVLITGNGSDILTRTHLSVS